MSDHGAILNNFYIKKRAINLPQPFEITYFLPYLPDIN